MSGFSETVQPKLFTWELPALTLGAFRSSPIGVTHSVAAALPGSGGSGGTGKRTLRQTSCPGLVTSDLGCLATWATEAAREQCQPAGTHQVGLPGEPGPS